MGLSPTQVETMLSMSVCSDSFYLLAFVAVARQLWRFLQRRWALVGCGGDLLCSLLRLFSFNRSRWSHCDQDYFRLGAVKRDHILVGPHSLYYSLRPPPRPRHASFAALKARALLLQLKGSSQQGDAYEGIPMDLFAMHYSPDHSHKISSKAGQPADNDDAF